MWSSGCFLFPPLGPPPEIATLTLLPRLVQIEVSSLLINSHAFAWPVSIAALIFLSVKRKQVFPFTQSFGRSPLDLRIVWLFSYEVLPPFSFLYSSRLSPPLIETAAGQVHSIGGRRGRGGDQHETTDTRIIVPKKKVVEDMIAKNISNLKPLKKSQKVSFDPAKDCEIVELHAYDEREDPTSSKGWCLVRVKCGVCTLASESENDCVWKCW
uniref:Uncharacterized protein n=1 Tax=Chromera velia CCMP2878 TaxID=1169474 RepID=A0A0G4FZ15_9ALVE|eukprot:Cvel_19338.t1-p1 / transcript=Cvel_19338.t1 / gene=Cvel_19338 / organism=Chromera_velia_CCMP2878 / gene_product=hypothetical protein / transcript_product=hypothetical protein / location=Cvel_scaffold1660:11907-12539(+) / protein_length=211 / sequence_SO=supercontig / SO=protein_coding / is_pseudo=false